MSDEITNEDAVERIINLNEGLDQFWAHSTGWAPVKNAELLTKSRLDWQASLSRQLRIFLNSEIQKETGALILAWTTLGSLTEGIMKLFLSIWYHDYSVEELKTDIKAIKDRDGNLIEPDSLVLDKLRIFFAKRIYTDEIREI